MFILPPIFEFPSILILEPIETEFWILLLPNIIKLEFPYILLLTTSDDDILWLVDIIFPFTYKSDVIDAPPLIIVVPETEILDPKLMGPINDVVPFTYNDELIIVRPFDIISPWTFKFDPTLADPSIIKLPSTGLISKS